MKASDWNRIETGVPEEGQLCLLRLKGGNIAVSAFEIVLDDKGKEFGAFAIDGSYYTIDFITHWMPIVPPKED
jgi:hypothetical protein